MTSLNTARPESQDIYIVNMFNDLKDLWIKFANELEKVDELGNSAAPTQDRRWSRKSRLWSNKNYRQPEKVVDELKKVEVKP